MRSLGNELGGSEPHAPSCDIGKRLFSNEEPIESIIVQSLGAHTELLPFHEGIETDEHFVHGGLMCLISCHGHRVGRLSGDAGLVDKVKQRPGRFTIFRTFPVFEGECLLAGKTTKTAAASLEDALWESANRLRSSMDAAEYKHVVLGLIFLKYVSDVFEQRRTKLDELSRDEASDFFTPTEVARLDLLEDRDEYTGEGVFWVPEGSRWDDLRKSAKQTDIGGRIDNAMEAIEKENPTLKGVLPKNYSRRELTPATLGGLIDLFSNEDLAAKEHESLDVLGRVFEYMLSKFASAEGKLGGEFFTPRGVVSLMVDMLEPFRGRVYDPACGSGGMFVQADRFVKAHNGSRNDISVFGQEQNPTTWRLAKMNLALRGIEANLGPQWGDSFTNDQHPDLRADFVIANPPFNIKGWGIDQLAGDVRWTHGVPPANNANFGWLQHMLHHLKPTGTMATVLANGSLSSQASGEGDIRRKLVEDDLVECIVSLPGQLFFTTQIPVCLWFLTKDKQTGACRPNARSATARARCCSSTPASSARWHHAHSKSSPQMT